MTMRRRLVLTSCIGLWMLLLPASRASAQLSNDPYSPWNAMYRPFVFPNTWYNPAIPNQARLSAAGRVETFDNFVDPFGDIGGDLFGRSTTRAPRGMPYYRAYQAQRAAAGVGSLRSGSAADARDDPFLADQEARQQRFFEAMRERNPRKRAEMLRQIEAERLAAARSASRPQGISPRDAARPSRSGLDATDPTPPDDRVGEAPAPRPALDPFTLMRPLSSSAPAPRAGGDFNFETEDAGARRPTLPRPRPIVPAELDNLLNRPVSDIPDPIIPRSR